MRLGSLFDGSGGFPLAGKMVGMTPVWASEVEPYPIAVTRQNIPEMLHVGSVTDIHGSNLPPVDMITFGSPCQNLSVAGNKKGLAGEKSGLFHEAIRIIKEMREATNERYPAFAVWENVPGAFSSNGGRDFRAVLEQLSSVRADVSIPQPDRWAYAGAIFGDGWSIAWRTLDAQYWGVPQRRNRIFLVADFAGQRAGEILFKPEGLPRDIAPGGEAGKHAADHAEGSVGGRCIGFDHNAGAGAGMPCLEDKTHPVMAGHGGEPAVVYAIQGNVIDRSDTAGCNGRGWREDAAFTLNTVDRQAVAMATGCGNAEVTSGFSPTLMAYHEQPILCQKSVLRRLTPFECGRLQGFPDGWGQLAQKDEMSLNEVAFWNGVRQTFANINRKAYRPLSPEGMVKWYNKLHSDANEYKMWGNGVALPCVKFIMGRIKEAYVD